MKKVIKQTAILTSVLILSFIGASIVDSILEGYYTLLFGDIVSFILVSITGYIIIYIPTKKTHDKL